MSHSDSSDNDSSLSEQSSASHHSISSSITQSSQETSVSLEEQNRRQQIRLEKLKRKLKKLQEQQLATSSSTSSQPSSKKAKKEKRQSQPGAPFQLNLAPKPKVLEMKNGKLTAEMVQNHGNSLISWAGGASNNATLNRDALTNLFSPEVQGIIIAKYKRYLQTLEDPDSYEQDIFNLDLEHHVRILAELFPHSTEKDNLSIIRASKDFRENWFTLEEHSITSIETFLTRLFGQRLNMLKNGRYPEGNGSVCTEA
jgi:hypothetical protein